MFKSLPLQLSASQGLQSLLPGGQVDVHDQSLYDQAPIGIVFATRIYQAGALNFMSNPGVPMTALEVPGALVSGGQNPRKGGEYRVLASVISTDLGRNATG